jgi:hypothetical protein
VPVVIGLLIGVVFWWGLSILEDRKDPLNKADSFVYSDSGSLYWFEVSSRKGKVEGNYLQQEVIEEVGKVPYLEEKKSPITGKTTENGYEFKIKSDGDILKYHAWFSGENFLVQKQGEINNISFEAVDQEKLDENIKALQKDLEKAIYHAEEKENNRLRNFFTDLRSVYGYLYSRENETFQLFIKIDEALLQGEISGSLLLMNHNGDKTNRYDETKYDFNGITDGIMVEIFTLVDGKETSMKGSYHEDASSFDLYFWKSDQKLSFQAVTEEEFHQKYEEFKTKAHE